MTNIVDLKKRLRHANDDDDYIAREYSPQLMRELIHAYEVSLGNKLPPAQAIFIVHTEEDETYKLDTDIVVLYSNTPDDDEDE